MSETPFQRGRRAVRSVLLREYLAHRPLWLALMVFGLGAAGLYPMVIGATDYVTALFRSLAVFFLIFSLFGFWTLSLLFKSFSPYIQELSEEDRIPFLNGLRQGLLLPLLLTLISAGLSLAVLALY